MHKVKLQPAPGYLNTFQFGLVEMRSAAEAERARAALQVGWIGPRNAVLMDGLVQHASQLVLLHATSCTACPHCLPSWGTQPINRRAWRTKTCATAGR